MRRSISGAVSIVLMLAALLAVSVSCSPDAADIQERATLSVSISSSDNRKTIAPDDPDIGVTHFRITISDGLGVNSVSDYIPAGNSFIVSDLRIGQWTISAEGYAYVDSSYVLLAKGSTPVTLTAGENSVSVKLEPVDAAAGDVSVSLLLPSSFGDGSFSYWFWITDIDGNPVTISQETGSSSSPLTGTAADGVGTFAISGMMQGGYLLYATIRDGEGKEYSAVEAMRLIAGMPASGTVEFPDTNLSVFFDFELNRDGESYTVTGLKEGMTQPDPDVFEIPSQYKGKPVTMIADDAFFQRKDITGTVVIPDSVTAIGKRSFAECSSIEEIIVPQGISIIEDYTFMFCSELKSINIPDNVTSIGENAFQNCTSLESIKLPDSLSSIMQAAFGGCSSLDSISFPSGISYIGNSAFSDCSGIKSLDIPENVGSLSIGINTFYGCSGLTSIHIPSGVNVISMGAFAVCSSLESIYCEDIEKLNGWDDSWFADYYSDVFWGVSRADYDSIIASTLDVAEPVITVSDDGSVSITCDTSFAHIYYTTDGSDPTAENGTLYEASFAVEEWKTVKAVAYVGMDTYSDIALFEELPEPEIGTVLSDGSVVFYDRGEEYGNYGIKDGDIVRLSESVDDESAESANWRYLICEEYDLPHYDSEVGPTTMNASYSGKDWGKASKVGTSTGIGTGLANTNHLIETYLSDTNYIWYYINKHRAETGNQWFLPSKDELKLIANNKNIIKNLSTAAHYSRYWSSSEDDASNAWEYYFNGKYFGVMDKTGSTGGLEPRVRLIRRI